MQGDVEELSELFRCPVTEEPLERCARGLRAVGTGLEYSVVEGTPVLLDPQDSVIDPASVNFPSPVTRVSSRAGELVRRLLRPPNPATVRNVETFVNRLLDRSPTPHILVVGGGTVGAGSELLYDHPKINVFAFDIYRSPNTHFVADGHRIPLVDACFDGVLVQAVLEHVVNPGVVVAEIRRVLRPGGMVYSEIPFLQGVHEGAYDFTRYTESGHRWLFREFEALDTGVVSGVGTQLAWALAGFMGAMFRSALVAKAVMAALSWLRLADRFSPRTWNSDYACATYFLGDKRDTGLTPRHIVTGYRGAQ